MGILGSQVKEANYILRFSIAAFLIIILFGSILFWKSQLMLAAEYQDMPVTEYQIKIKKENLKKQEQMKKQNTLKSKLVPNYNLEE